MRLPFLVMLLLVWPARAAADSDGYFCHAAGYVAWETWLGTATDEHILHVVRFDHATGIRPTERIVLPHFQVHGMTCGAARMELAGWTTMYRVELSEAGRPSVTSLALPFDATRWPQPENLGYRGRSGITDLEADGRTGEFELVVARVSRQVAGGGGIDHHVVARVVQREMAPGVRVVASRVLMEGIYFEAVDDDQRVGGAYQGSQLAAEPWKEPRRPSRVSPAPERVIRRSRSLALWRHGNALC